MRSAGTSANDAVVPHPPAVASRVQNIQGNGLNPAPQPVAVGGGSCTSNCLIFGNFLERRGLFYEDLGSLDRYPPGLQPLMVVRDDVPRLMAREDFALQMQLHIEHHEECIYAFDRLGDTFHLQSALGHREVHQWLAGVLHRRLIDDLNENILPAVDSVRFLRIPTRPPLQQIVTNFRGKKIR